MRQYRPSNGTEGEIFMGQWCSRCIKESGCSIILGVLCGKHQKQWVMGDDGPLCTSFLDHREQRSYRCKKTSDLFA